LEDNDSFDGPIAREDCSESLRDDVVEDVPDRHEQHWLRHVVLVDLPGLRGHELGQRGKQRANTLVLLTSCVQKKKQRYCVRWREGGRERERERESR
jgi:hypothetical protein